MPYGVICCVKLRFDAYLRSYPFYFPDEEFKAEEFKATGAVVFRKSFAFLELTFV